jgi:hypothetical protein
MREDKGQKLESQKDPCFDLRFRCCHMTADISDRETQAKLEITNRITRFMHLVFSPDLQITRLNPMVWVRERTIPTERPQLVSEVIENFCGEKMPRGLRDGFLRPYSRFSRQEPLLFYQVTPQLYSRGWVDPVSDPLHFFSGSAGNRTASVV